MGARPICVGEGVSRRSLQIAAPGPMLRCPHAAVSLGDPDAFRVLARRGQGLGLWEGCAQAVRLLGTQYIGVAPLTPSSLISDADAGLSQA